MKTIKNRLTKVLSVVFALMLSGCVDNNMFVDGSEEYGESTSLTLNIAYNPLVEGLATRGVDANLDFDFRDITVVFYDANANETTGKPAIDDDGNPLIRRYYLNGDYSTSQEERIKTTTEHHTRHAAVTVKDIKPGTYRIYAIANVDGIDDLKVDNIAAMSEQALREYSINFDYQLTGTGRQKDPRTHNIPDAMFGFFHKGDDSKSHEDEYKDEEGGPQQDVIHHDPAIWNFPSSGLTFNPDSKNGVRDITDNRAPAIEVKGNTIIHSWLKRTISRLTVGYDGSQLNRGVEIYVKSVHVKDVVKTCYLGHDNSVTEPLTLFNDSEDERLNIVYSTEEGAVGTAITRFTPAFPRTGMDEGTSTKGENGWNSTWYNYVHGSPNAYGAGNSDIATLDPAAPAGAYTPETLYFMENLQGKVTDYTEIDYKKGLFPKSYRDDWTAGGEWDKDGKPNGTYVEVDAYYVNTNKNTRGAIKYRFMLGQNITDDFNAERNRHYKLTLSFIGDANNVDWHIEYDEEKKPYFPIPDEAQWKQSSVWYAYNDEGEPIAEMVKEMVYYDPKDPNFEYAFVPKADERYYFQVVTVYPVYKEGDKFETDLSNGRIAQVLHCDNSILGNAKGDAVITDILDKLEKKVDVKLSMHRRGIKFSNKLRKTTTSFAQNTNFYRGYYVIESLDWNWIDDYALNNQKDNHENSEIQNNDNWVINSADETQSSYYFVEVIKQENGSVKFRLGNEQNKQYRIAAYRMKAFDSTYPVVKIGASYWMREDFNGTHYVDGQEIYPYKTDDEYGYTHNAPAQGYVNYDDKFPMYFDDAKYGKLYNFFAASGAYDPYWHADSNEQPNKKGYTDHTECDPSFSYYGEDNIWYLQDKSPANLKLAEGWILPNTYGIAWEWAKVENPDVNNDDDYWARTLPDHLYICEYMGNNYSRAMGNSSNATWEEGIRVGVYAGQENLSGLGLLPVPASYIITDASGHKVKNESAKISFKVADNNTNNIVNAYIPFWDVNLAATKDEYAPGSSYFYALPSRLIGESDDYPNCIYITRPTGFKLNLDYAIEANKAYLPIRLLRDRMNYSVNRLGE